MIRLKEDENLGKDSNNVNLLNNLSEKVKRKINTENERELDRKQKIIDNTSGIRFKYLFAVRFNELCNKEFIMTGDQARKKLDIDPSTFSKYKNGSKFPSSPNELIRLADIFNVSPDYLLGVTDSTSLLPPNMNMKLGLSENARICLYQLYHYIEDGIIDIDKNLSHSDFTVGMLEIFSLFIENFSDFCDFLTYIKRYVEVKQDIIELTETNEILDYKGKKSLDDDLIRN